MGRCSGRILLALAGLLCLMSHGFGALIPQDISDQSAPPPVTIDQRIAKAEKDDAEKNGKFYFSEKTHLIRRELDMVFTVDQWMDIQHGRQKRTAAIRPSRREQRWTNGIVNYELKDGSFSRRELKIIYRGIRDIEHYTCITMRETSSAWNRVLVSEGDGGCYSYVGMIGGAQDLGLSRGCRYKDTVIHEFLHAIGIHHEQTRPDRDDHVTIALENIVNGVAYNFDKYKWNYINNYSLPYDYASVMHYGQTAFAKSSGLKTIVTKDSYYQDKIGTPEGLSMGDIRTLNGMYNCVPASCTLTENDCKKQGGWVGKDCKCWCEGPDQFHNKPVEYCSGVDVQENGSLNDCKDLSDDCQNYKNAGDCTSESDRWSYMFKNCQRSCNLC